MLKKYVKKLYEFFDGRLSFKRPPKIIFKNDAENAQNILGQTGYYDPMNYTIAVFSTNRHPKDVLRSVAHELIHHWQNCQGRFNTSMFDTGEGYINKNKYMKEIEQEAYERGNILFREWEEDMKSKNLKLNEKLMKEYNINVKDELFTELLEVYQELQNKRNTITIKAFHGKFLSIFKREMERINFSYSKAESKPIKSYVFKNMGIRSKVTFSFLNNEITAKVEDDGKNYNIVSNDFRSILEELFSKLNIDQELVPKDNASSSIFEQIEKKVKIIKEENSYYKFKKIMEKINGNFGR